MKYTFLLSFAIAILLYSCSSKPSEDDIKKKLLQEYICPGNAEVSALKILDTKDAESFAGYKGYTFTVSGEVEWKEECREFMSVLPAGYKEPFENKRVTLIKTENGWH